MLKLILVIILVIGVFVDLVWGRKVLNELKNRHYQVWESLGKPQGIKIKSFQDQMHIRKFFWKKEYKRLNDPVLTKQANLYMLFGYAYTSYWLVVFLAFIFKII